jgi:colanic acid/amylovoran biosynthesis protein
MGVNAAWIIPEAEAQSTRDADVVIDLSGDMLTEDSGSHLAYSHYLPILRALLLDRPVMLCAQSIGPFKITTPLARYILNRVKVVTVREPITLDYLHALGLKNTDIHVTADLAFLLEPSPQKRAQEILRREGIRLSRQPVLGVSISQLVEDRYRRANPEARHRDFAAVMAAVLDRFIAAYDGRVLFIPHVTGPTDKHDDRRAHRWVRERMIHAEAAYALNGDYRPDELKALIGCCDIFMGARMHANIAALSSCVPTVAIAYSHKTPGIMASCALQEFMVRTETMTIQETGDKLDTCWQSREALTHMLQEKLPDVQSRARQNIAFISGIVEPYGRGHLTSDLHLDRPEVTLHDWSN